MLPVKFDVQKTYLLYFFIVGMIQVDLFNWFDAYVYLFRSDFIRQIMHSAWEQCKVMYSSFFFKDRHSPALSRVSAEARIDDDS